MEPSCGPKPSRPPPPPPKPTTLPPMPPAEAGSVDPDTAPATGPKPAGGKSEEGRIARRQKIVEEILSTEKTHCAGLGYLIEHCLNPLKQAEILPPETMQTIFCNVEDIYKYSLQLIEIISPEIENWNEDTSRVARPFVTFCEPMLAAYGKYMENHERAIQELNAQIKKRSKLEQFLEQFKEAPENNSWTLEMYLITPVQRLLRYSLLFKDYRAHTRDDSDEAGASQELLAALEKCAAAVNDTVKRKQNALQLQKIRDSFASLPKDVSEVLLGDHLFVREGSLTKVCRKTNMRRYFWLFSDCMLYGVNATQGYVFHRYIPLAKLKVKSLADTDEITNAFQIITTEKSFIVMADTPCEKDFWIMDITECLGKGRQRNLNEEVYTGGKSDADSGEAPVWVPDKLAPHCMICGKSFSTIKRRHHCRNCGKVVCGACSSQKRIIPGLDLSKPERVCKFCYDLLEIQEAEKTSAETGKVVVPNLLCESRGSGHWQSPVSSDLEPSGKNAQKRQSTSAIPSPYSLLAPGKAPPKCIRGQSVSVLPPLAHPIPIVHSSSNSMSKLPDRISDSPSDKSLTSPSSPLSQPSADVMDELEELRGKVASYEKEIAELRELVKEVNELRERVKEVDQLRERLKEAKLHDSQSEAMNHDGSDEVNELRARVAQLEQENNSLRQQQQPRAPPRVQTASSLRPLPPARARTARASTSALPSATGPVPSRPAPPPPPQK